MEQKRVLFICSQNRLRSPTAEQVFASHRGIECASAGTNHDADNPLTPELVEWAEIIFVMEKTHRDKINSKFRQYLANKRVICLDILDEYEYMDPELVRLLRAKVPRFLPVAHETSDDQERILELLRREASHGRQHTSDSSWHDRSPAGKSIVERAWFDSLIVELEADGNRPYKPAIASDDEWPDWEATLVGSGGRVAVEVSEVVRGTSLAPGGRPEPWSGEQFLEAVQSRITEKDAKGFHGGRFAEYMVLLHSDEFFLVQEWVGPALQGVTFNLPHGTIDTAYLILGYRGGRRAYFRLSLAAHQRIASDAPQAARA